MSILIIGEKPSVSRAISSVVGAGTAKKGYTEGNGYIVSWCVGHLVGLKYPNDYGNGWENKWSFSQLPMLPEKWQFQVTDKLVTYPRTDSQYLSDDMAQTALDVVRLCDTHFGFGEEKIPKREQRIEQGWKKIDSLTDKRDRISHKLDRVVALNDTIRSFSIGFNKERREAFSDAMSRLNRASVECLNDKKNSCIAQKDVLMQTYNDPATNMVDKYKIQQKINDISERISAFEDKIMKLSRPETHYAEQTNDALDAQMKLTSEKFAEMTDKETVSMPVLAEETLIAASKTDELDKSKVAELADNFNSIDIPIIS